MRKRRLRSGQHFVLTADGCNALCKSRVQRGINLQFKSRESSGGCTSAPASPRLSVGVVVALARTIADKVVRGHPLLIEGSFSTSAVELRWLDGIESGRAEVSDRPQDVTVRSHDCHDSKPKKGGGEVREQVSSGIVHAAARQMVEKGNWDEDENGQDGSNDGWDIGSMNLFANVSFDSCEKCFSDFPLTCQTCSA